MLLLRQSLETVKTDIDLYNLRPPLPFTARPCVLVTLNVSRVCLPLSCAFVIFARTVQYFMTFVSWNSQCQLKEFTFFSCPAPCLDPGLAGTKEAVI